MRKLLQFISVSTTLILLSAGCGSDHSEVPHSMTQQNSSVIQQDRLAPCPNTPNCVVSEGSEGRAAVDPISYSGAPERAWATLRQFLEETGGTIESETDTFLHATFRSKVFRFVDDVSCRLDVGTGKIHIRSASRTGYYDFGVNRDRVENVRRFLVEQQI